MQGTLKVTGQLGFLPIFVLLLVFTTTVDPQHAANISRRVPQDSECLSPGVLTNALKQLSESYDEAQRAHTTFIKAASKSARCKQQIVSSIMQAMDKPGLDIRRNQGDYYLWREGSTLLGELKATEALDLLISHMGMSDGEWSVSMVHQPALGGIIEMGPIAIPKLRVVLGSQDPATRQDAVYCIAQIGGPSALRVLKQALPSESDKCIQRFIQASLKSLDNEKNKLKDNGEWLPAFLCN
jgi:hypothetical protein